MGDSEMLATRKEDNHMFTVIEVAPWPDLPHTASIRVVHNKRDAETGKHTNDVNVCYSAWPVATETAREFAQAILRACDIAEQLQRDGSIVLEGE